MNLVLLTDQFPFEGGEYFLDTELTYANASFNNVYILSASGGRINPSRKIPEKAVISSMQTNPRYTEILQGLYCILLPVLWEEVFRIVNHSTKLSLLNVLKVAVMDWIRSGLVLDEVEMLIKRENLDKSDTIFYSYWHDYKSLGLARLQKKHNVKCIARAHGWDVFKDRHIIPYLPFKAYILQNLTTTYAVSEKGVDVLKTYVAPRFHPKIQSFYLGTEAISYQVEANSNERRYVVCSCSSMTAIKRVHLIIEALFRISEANVHWIHFGTGPLFEQIKEQAVGLPGNIKVELKGYVPNDEIRSFYAHQQVDLFLNLSSDEGIPVSMMEAMSAAIPVLSTDVGGVSELVNDDNGYLVDRNITSAEVSEILAEIFLTSKKELKIKGEKAQKTWKEKFKASINYPAFYNLIQAD